MNKSNKVSLAGQLRRYVFIKIMPCKVFQNSSYHCYSFLFHYNIWNLRETFLSIHDVVCKKVLKQFGGMSFLSVSVENLCGSTFSLTFFSHMIPQVLCCLATSRRSKTTVQKTDCVLFFFFPEFGTYTQGGYSNKNNYIIFLEMVRQHPGCHIELV